MAIGYTAFQPHTLPAVALEQEPSRRPDPIEAVELGRVLLCVSFEGKEILADEFGSLLIHRLGIRPSTGSSSATVSGTSGKSYTSHTT